MSLAVALATGPARLGARLATECRGVVLARARVVAIGLLLLSAGALAAGLFMWAGQRFAPPPMSFVTTVLPIAATFPMALAYALVGALLATQRPCNAIGWLFLAIGVLSSFLPAVDLLVASAATQYVAPAGTTVLFAWLSSNFHLPLMSALVIVVFLLFPEGRALSPRWGRAGWLAIAGALLVGFGQALDPSGLRWYPTLPNPTAGPAWFGPMAFVIALAGMAAIVGALGLAMWAMVLRWRAYDAATRRGLAAIAGSVLALALTGGSLVVVRYGLTVSQATGEVVLVATLLAATSVPLVAVFGMHRYHLFDVDLVLAHALVYVPLTGVLAGLYAAAVSLFTRIFIAVTGDSSDVVIVLATLVLAGTFAPLRKALETFVDGHFKPAERAAKRARRRGQRASRAAAGESGVDPLTELRELQARLARLEERLAGAPAK